jgi:molybdopterin molybdotransferase
VSPGRPLISIDAAREQVLAAVRPLGSEEVPLQRALGRVLAEDVTSALSVPPFTSSAMDGYAVAAGPEAELEVIGESRAGHPAAVIVRPGVAVRISTGAAVPEGADAVVPVENAGAAAPNGRVRVPAVDRGENVRYPGEDVAAGTLVLRAGSELGPAELGVAASVGRPALRCSLRPRVAVLVTGDELTEPGNELRPGGIYSSNAFALAGQVERAGAEIVMQQTVPDHPEGTRAALEGALGAADVVVASGGVSVGLHDHVKGALTALGVEERFWGVLLRPGKPIWFGTHGEGALVFGVPGNPVSAMVTFQFFARPALAALQGADPSARRGWAVLDEPVPRHSRREQAVRVRLRAAQDGWHALLTGGQDSHMLSSMLGADALARIAPGEGDAEEGDRVEIELL